MESKITNTRSVRLPSQYRSFCFLVDMGEQKHNIYFRKTLFYTFCEVVEFFKNPHLFLPILTLFNIFKKFIYM